MSAESGRPEISADAELSDEQLYQRFRLVGASADFAVIVDRHFAGLRAYIARRVGSDHRAEELAQEAFLRVFARSATWEPTRRFKPWLYAIAVNLVRADFRDRLGEPTVVSLTGSGESASNNSSNSNSGAGALLGTLPDSTPTPETQTIANEIAAVVRRAIAELPEAQQEVLVLSQYQGLSYPEIAEATGRPLGTIKSHMHHAVRALRAKLEALRRKLDEAN